MKIQWRVLAMPLVLMALALTMVLPAHSFLPQGSGIGSTFVPSAWTTLPIPWVINPSTTGANIVGTVPVTTVINNAFDSWHNAPDTTIATTNVGTSGITDANNVPAGTNLICFICTGLNFNGDDGTLGLTLTTYGGSGQITQASIFFNPAPGVSGTPICWVTDGTTPCPSGDTPQDLQTVATHEIGHFFGLDHSAIVRAVMFPYAPTVLTTLSFDDVAAISFLYPNSAPQVQTGSISGQVTLSGTGVFGAHVFANSTSNVNPFGAFINIRKSPIGTLTFPDGTYTITGLPVDSYLVIAEPLDGPVTDSNVSWGAEWGQGSVQTDFTTRWH